MLSKLSKPFSTLAHRRRREKVTSKKENQKKKGRKRRRLQVGFCVTWLSSLPVSLVFILKIYANRRNRQDAYCFPYFCYRIASFHYSSRFGQFMQACKSWLVSEWVWSRVVRSEENKKGPRNLRLCGLSGGRVVSARALSCLYVCTADAYAGPHAAKQQQRQLVQPLPACTRCARAHTHARWFPLHQQSLLAGTPAPPPPKSPL